MGFNFPCAVWLSYLVGWAVFNNEWGYKLDSLSRQWENQLKTQ